MEGDKSSKRRKEGEKSQNNIVGANGPNNNNSMEIGDTTGNPVVRNSLLNIFRENSSKNNFFQEFSSKNIKDVICSDLRVQVVLNTNKGYRIDECLGRNRKTNIEIDIYDVLNGGPKPSITLIAGKMAIKYKICFKV